MSQCPKDDSDGDAEGKPAGGFEEAGALSVQELERRGAVIGEITVSVREIFDPERPGEDRWVFRLANRLHRTTRPGVIQRLLLFETGDRFDSRLLAESERLLRSQDFLIEGAAVPLCYRADAGGVAGVGGAAGVVDVGVVTRDVWTTRAAVSVKRSGGVNRSRFELSESSILGLGKELSVQRTSSVDRDTSSIRYRDRNLAGTRGQLEALYADNSDGRFRFLAASRPFYSLDTRRAGAFEGWVDDRVDRRYRLGEIFDGFRHRQEHVTLTAGRSRGLVDGRTRRWSVGFTYLEDQFERVAGEPQPVLLPADRTLAFPWLSFQSIEDRFTEERGVDQLARTEDLQLGRSLFARVGVSSSLFGGDLDRLVFDGRFDQPQSWGDGSFLFSSVGGAGRWGSDGLENVLVSGSLRLYWQNLGRHRLFVLVEADIARDLDRERQLLLGGDSGLRGYPLRYAEGDRRALVTIEQRFYTNWELFRLLNVGGAIFVDVGRAWFAGAGPPDPGWLGDVGVGVRIGSNRSSEGTLVHFDVAMPLQRDGTIRGLQWLVTTKRSF